MTRSAIFDGDDDAAPLADVVPIGGLLDVPAVEGTLPDPDSYPPPRDVLDDDDPVGPLEGPGRVPPTVDGTDPTGVIGAVTAGTAKEATIERRDRDRASALGNALTPQMGLDLGIEHTVKPAVSLRDRFVVPPFSTLDARSAEWKDRKQSWLGLGIDGELGRDGGLAYENTATILDPDFYRKKEDAEARLGRRFGVHEFILSEHYVAPDTGGRASVVNSGTSVFDPVLCEVAYRWFSPSRGVVLDPFAGGSVRGIVASILGRRYVGVELRPEQIAANRVNAAGIVGPDAAYDFGGDTPPPTWVEGDAAALPALDLIPPGVTPTRAGEWADLVFTCPPYADLEVYSDDPRDLSTMPYPAFRALLASALAHAAHVLRPDRYLVVVMGEARDPKTGNAYGTIYDTIRGARDAGLALYNEAILTTAIASAAVRAGRQVTASRKLVRIHQHVLVFVKGDGRRAADACGDPTRLD